MLERKNEIPHSNNIQNDARYHITVILALVSLIGAVVLVLAPSRRATAQAGASWSYTGNLKQGRSNHTATLLPGGKVLVVGGNTSVT